MHVTCFVLIERIILNLRCGAGSAPLGQQQVPLLPEHIVQKMRIKLAFFILCANEISVPIQLLNADRESDGTIVIVVYIRSQGDA